MAVFTTTSKNRLIWPSPVVEQGVADQDYFLSISDGYFLDIGGYKLVITPADAPISWEKVTKKKLNYPSRPTTTGNLDIGDGYALNIGNDYTLVIQGSRNIVNWTKTRKTR